MTDLNDFEKRLRTLEAKFDIAELAGLRVEHDQMREQLSTFSTNMAQYAGLWNYHKIEQMQDHGTMNQTQDLKAVLDPVIDRVDALTSVFDQLHIEHLVAQVDRSFAQAESTASQIEHLIGHIDFLTSAFNKLLVEDMSTRITHLVARVDYMSTQNKRMLVTILESAVQGTPVKDIFRFLEDDAMSIQIPTMASEATTFTNGKSPSKIVPRESLPTCPDESSISGDDSLDRPAVRALKSTMKPKLEPNAPEFTPSKSVVTESAMSVTSVSTEAQDNQDADPNTTHSRHHIKGLPNKSLQDSIHKPKPPFCHPGYRYDNYPKSAPVSPTPPVPADVAIKRFHEKLAKHGLEAMPAGSEPKLTQEQIIEAAYGSLALFEEKLTEKIENVGCACEDIMVADVMMAEETEKESRGDGKEKENDGSMEDVKGTEKIHPNEVAEVTEKMQALIKEAQAKMKMALMEYRNEKRQKDDTAGKAETVNTVTASPKKSSRADLPTPTSAKSQTPSFADFMAASKSFSKQYAKK